MTAGISGLLAAFLTTVSVMSLSLLSLLCVRCKKKSKIIHEESQIYDPRIFQRGGSKFAVMQSKTVTRSNPITTGTIEPPDDYDYPEASNEDQSDYQNITKSNSSLEHDYVAPIAVSVYANEEVVNTTCDADQSPGVYGNVFPSLPVSEDNDDYENSEFLLQETEEPDYVNENGECT